MEDERISRMYVRLLRRQITGAPRRATRWMADHGWQSVALLLMLLVLVGLVARRERGRGHLSRLKSELKPQQPSAPPPPVQPGGQDPIVLQRSQMAGSTMPEFLSVTLLPGRGMNTLQITAFLPDKGEVQLLASPSVDGAAAQLTGKGSDEFGAASLALGGALELPWAGLLPGNDRAADPDKVQLNWRGHGESLPRSSGASLTGSDGGLLLTQSAVSTSSNVMPDGGEAQATYSLGDFGGRWPSKTDARVTVLLSSRVVEIHVVARNTGTEPEPIGIGWRPHFAVLSGDRSQVALHLPTSLRIEHHPGGLPTGRLLPVTGTPYDFTSRDGTPLRALALDETFVHLRPALLDVGPMMELRDPKSDYGLRLTAMSPSIRAFHLASRPGTNEIVIDPRFNYDDPFGREWPSDEDTGMVVVEPGRTAQWRVRIELFPLSTGIPGNM